MSTDILMITYNRPEYTRLALPRLLETCDQDARVWLWHNGDHAETLEVVKSLADHPRVHEFHHSLENKMLRVPTNWFWSRAEGELLGKVDDDCLVPEGWIHTLRRAHSDVPEFGIVSCWPFLEEDFLPEVAGRKIREFNGHKLLQNFWVGGSGYLMKRSIYDQLGPLHARESFSGYCNRAAAKGWVNGWCFPLLYMDHMEDPRSPYCTLKTEADFVARPSLSARRFGIWSLAALQERARRAAIEVQEASINPADHFSWRAHLVNVARRIVGRGRVARFNP